MSDSQKTAPGFVRVMVPMTQEGENPIPHIEIPDDQGVSREEALGIAARIWTDIQPSEIEISAATSEPGIRLTLKK